VLPENAIVVKTGTPAGELTGTSLATDRNASVTALYKSQTDASFAERLGCGPEDVRALGAGRKERA
jgi:hypothetical protein